MKKLMLSLLATQLLLASPIFAKDEAQDRGCCHPSKNCTEPKGVTYRGYGPNLAPVGGTVFFKGNMFDPKGCQVGIVSAESTGTTAPVTNIFRLNNGSTLEVVLTRISTLASFFPVDATTVACFPETAPFLGNPNAQVMTTDCNHTATGDANVISWNGTGSFKKANVLQVRCAFLVLSGNIVDQLGCQWFIGRQR